MNKVDDLINSITNKFSNSREFHPYISSIRFPRYKGLKADTKIHFNFPLTVLVGENGNNKTSVLQALFGTKNQQSVGKYWFSTEVDKISASKEEGPHCLIYSYFHQCANKEVEVLKTRIHKEGNLDYWEPSRPLKKYKMDIPEKEELEKSGNSSKTRWDPIEKEIVFCDFKEYLSAFDMYFYHHVLSRGKIYKTKQDFIRQRSKHLAEVIKNNTQSFSLYSTERIDTNETLSQDVCDEVSRIMGQNYKEIRLISHRLYSRGDVIRPLKTILMKKGDLDYTEAFAGSGESRLILLVNDIMTAADKSLILIDEPEINLHPRALVRFQIFLLEQILKKSHQIVLTTHSHFLIDKLPKTAIKLFQSFENEISITEDIEYSDVFIELGEEIDKNINIYVEDRLAKEIVEKGIKHCKVNSVSKITQVQFLPGGAQAIIKNHIYSSAMKGDSDVFYILDGDQDILSLNEYSYISSEWIVGGKIQQTRIPESDNSILSDIIRELTNTEIDFITSGGEDRTKEKYGMQRKFLDFWSEHVHFLPSTTPEMAILESLGQADDIVDAKEVYKQKTIDFLKSEDISSNDILFVQRRDINSLSTDCPLIIRLGEILTDIWDKTK